VFVYKTREHIDKHKQVSKKKITSISYT